VGSSHRDHFLAWVMLRLVAKVALVVLIVVSCLLDRSPTWPC
jgi:hypothetical protein